MNRKLFHRLARWRIARLWWAVPALAAALAAGALLVRPASDRPATATALPGIHIGQPAPDFTLPDLAGRRIHLAALRGRPVLLNFWSVTCIPCRQEMPALNRASHDLAVSLGTAAPMILGIEDPIDDPASGVLFAHRYHIDYPILSDTLRAISITSYHVADLPSSVFIDRAGLVRSVHLGPLDYPAIVHDLRALR